MRFQDEVLREWVVACYDEVTPSLIAATPLSIVFDLYPETVPSGARWDVVEEVFTSLKLRASSTTLKRFTNWWHSGGVGTSVNNMDWGYSEQQYPHRQYILDMLVNKVEFKAAPPLFHAVPTKFRIALTVLAYLELDWFTNDRLIFKAREVGATGFRLLANSHGVDVQKETIVFGA